MGQDRIFETFSLGDANLSRWIIGRRGPHFFCIAAMGQLRQCETTEDLEK